MLYKYNCAKCGEIEINTSPKNIPLKECPNCGCTEIERIFSAINNVWHTSGAFSKSNNKE